MAIRLPLVVVVVVVFLLPLLGGPQTEPAPMPVPGDENGDQQVDLSDPIYLLLHLYAEGAPPVPVCEDEVTELRATVARLEAENRDQAEELEYWHQDYSYWCAFNGELLEYYQCAFESCEAGASWSHCPLAE